MRRSAYPRGTIVAVWRPSFPLLAILLWVASAGAGTIRLGQGLDGWRLGQRYEQRPGLVRSVRYPGNEAPGCDVGPQSAARIDYYRGGVRLAWRGLGTRRSMYLIDVATVRRGDRSGDGFVIGRSRLRDVRRAHPRAALASGRGPFRLGRLSLTLTRKAGEEAWVSFTYWFGLGGRLVGLETLRGGC